MDERSELRRRLAEVFGEVLPTQTAEDRPEPAEESRGDEARLRAEVPPHHG